MKHRLSFQDATLLCGLCIIQQALNDEAAEAEAQRLQATDAHISLPKKPYVHSGTGSKAVLPPKSNTADDLANVINFLAPLAKGIVCMILDWRLLYF